MTEQKQFNFRLDGRSAFILFLFLLFLGGILAIKVAALRGLILILSIVVFGAVALFLKETNLKMIGLAAIILLSIINIGIYGVKFGIDFSGGTKIPVLLDKRVDQATMGELLEIVKKRANVLALTETKVKAIGDSEISVELPSGDEQLIQSIENSLSKQGVFIGVVDGKIAVSGDDVYSQTVQLASLAELQGSAAWGVRFSVTRQGAERFAQAAKGKGGYPIFMFLDRPSNAIIVMSTTEMKKNAPAAVTDFEILTSLKDALKLDNDSIDFYLVENIRKNKTDFMPRDNETKAIVSNSTPSDIRDLLVQKGFVIIEVPDDEISPTYGYNSQTQKLTVDQWRPLGLLNSPFLSDSIANGLPNYNYVISGPALGSGAQQQKTANENAKQVESILKSGSLPVQISLGSRTSIPATLGREFLNMSLLGIVAALVAIGIMIAIRYQSMSIIIPIIAISISEFLILLSILGSFTIDLAGVAGIIAAIGVGVDAQIVITDELRKKSEISADDRIAEAFGIIKVNTIIAIVAMLPLMFLGPQEVVGFAISTILGSILGFLLSRPAYAVLAKRVLFAHPQKEEIKS